uniref:Uncharacterized protein n=1 Tax=Molossus molossus TaxID=27622 RepID=A0A7J8FSI2_MOLMO|nr:hypothetical protein HJG59_008359 [Molossus molossus]
MEVEEREQANNRSLILHEAGKEIQQAAVYLALLPGQDERLDPNLKTKKKILEEANKAFEYNLQIVNGLDQAGSMLSREILEDGLPVHSGKEVCVNTPTTLLNRTEVPCRVEAVPSKQPWRC